MDKSLNSLVDIRDEIKFLFDEEIHEYTVLIINKASVLSTYYGKEKDKDYYELRDWIRNQLLDKKLLRKKFELYLDLSKYGLSKDK